jgi:hypothetical protein
MELHHLFLNCCKISKMVLICGCWLGMRSLAVVHYCLVVPVYVSLDEFFYVSLFFTTVGWFLLIFLIQRYATLLRFRKKCKRLRRNHILVISNSKKHRIHGKKHRIIPRWFDRFLGSNLLAVIFLFLTRIVFFLSDGSWSLWGLMYHNTSHHKYMQNVNIWLPCMFKMHLAKVVFSIF